MNIWRNLCSGNDYNISNEAKIWNEFVASVCANDITNLVGPHRIAALVFWYDAEVNNGGHSNYFDCCPNILPEHLINALNEVGANRFAQNFQNALDHGRNDCYVDVDSNFGKYSPSLITILQKYVISHATDIGIV